LIGLRNGLVRFYSIDNALKTGTLDYHNKSITGLTVLDSFVYSSSLDGTILRSSTENDFESADIVLSRNVPLRSLAVTENTLFAVAGDSEILILPLVEAQDFSRSVVSSIPLVSLAANDEVFVAGTKSGSILKWNSETLELYYELKEHTSQINYLLLHGTYLYSASDDATIIQWSLNTNEVLKTLKRNPSNTLGHMGPVKGLSICNGVLFSVGVDKTTRRWNIKATRNDDVYFGASAAVTSVICYNGSVFSGSDDSAVLMYKPLFSVEPTKKISTAISRTSTHSKRRTKAVIKNQLPFAASSQLEFWIVGVSLVVALFVLGYIIFLFMRKSKRNIPTVDNIVANDASSSAITDLQTLVNSVVGISKHAALLMEHSSFARVKKIAAGGGGELFIVKIMDPLLKKKHGETLVQKIVFVRSKISEEAFYQEVGIMVTLLRFKNFCQIIGYTDQPLSLILKYYDLGSLKDWIRENQPSQKTAVKISRDISKALETMHNHYLAHCDIKTQNILMEKLGESVSCVLTDFGITQVLSEKIIATRSFHIINIRGLSIQYAAPEALFNFRSKKYNKVDFKMYDIYSFGCVIFEVLTRKAPW
jgi:tRNA A-37 threonylcarbamoyl transferase component Bud32